MPRPYEIIAERELTELIRGYSDALNVPVLMLDLEKKVLAGHPPGTDLAGLVVSPLELRGGVAGYLASTGGKTQEFIAGNLGRLLERGFEVESLASEVARVYEELSLHWKLSSRLGAGLDVDRICGVLSDEVMSFCPSNNLSVLLFGETPERAAPCLERGSAPPEPPVRLLLPKVSLGADAGSASTMALRADSPLFRHVFESKAALAITDVEADARFDALPYTVKSLLVVPLIVEDTVMGALVLSDKSNGEEFFTTDIKFIQSIANECAVSIKKALLYGEIHQMLFGITDSFISAIDAKHPYTYGHSRRVSELCVTVGREAGLSSETLGWLRLAGLLHDIGKIGTPEMILDKDGALEPDEVKRVRDHAITGSKLVMHIQRMREIARWICHHHEKWDGTGYPSGLVGEEIPLPSRMIAIADYFDALTTDRSYRKAFPKAEAMAVMEKSIGTHFDPQVFEYFRKAVS